MDAKTALSLAIFAGALAANALTFTPPQLSAVRKQLDAGSGGAIPGLLSRVNRRQGCGDYGVCQNTGSCCPIGGDCCKYGGCCDPGSFCHPSVRGCCLRSEAICHNYCMPIGANCCPDGHHCPAGWYCGTYDGKTGCCPIGEVCSGDPGDPTTVTQTRPTTQTTPRTTTTPTTTPRTTATPTSNTKTTEDITFTTDTSPDFTSTTQATTTFASVTSPTRTFTLTSSPAATTGVTNTTVGATDSRITYSNNVAWSSSVAVSCISYSGTSKKCSEEGGTITFSFTGTGVYLTVTSQPFARLFSVSIDGADAVTVDSYSATTQCAVAWAVWGLANTAHTVKIVTLGPTNSGPHSGRRGFEAFEARQSGQYDFELVNVVFSQHSTASAASTTSSPTGLGVTGGATRADWNQPLTLALGVWFLSLVL